MAMREKFYKILRIKITALAVLIVLLFIAVQTPWVKQVIAKRIVEKLSLITESKVDVQSYDGLIPLSFDFYGISFEQDGKQWLHVERLSLNRTLIRFFFWKNRGIDVSVIHPELAAIPKISTSLEDGFKWPELPFKSLSIHLEAFEIDVSKELTALPWPRFNSFSDLHIRRYGDIVQWNAKFNSSQLDDTSLAIDLRGFKKSNQVSLTIKASDLNQELANHFFDIELPGMEGKLKMKGAPGAIQAFFNPTRESDQTFSGSISADLIPNTEEKDLLDVFLEEEPLHLESNFSFDGKSGLSFESATLEGVSLDVSGSGQLTRDYEFQSTRVEGVVKSLSFLSQSFDKVIDGKLFFNGSLQGPYQSPELQAHFLSRRLKSDSFEGEKIKGDFVCKRINQEFIGSLSMQANLNYNAYSLKTDYTVKSVDDYTFERLSLSYGQNQVQTNSFRCYFGAYGGTLNFNLENMALFSPFLGQAIHGSARGSLLLDSNFETKSTLQSISLDMTGGYFQQGDFEVKDYSLRASGQVDPGDIYSYLGSINFQNEGFTWRKYYFSEMSLELSPRQKTSPYVLSTKGSLAINSSGQITKNEKDWTLFIQSLDGEIENEPYQLTQSVVANFSKTELEFSPVNMNVGPGSLYLNLDQKAETLSTLLNKFPVKTLALFIPNFDIRGYLNLEGTFDHLKSKMRGKLKGGMYQFTIEEHHKMSPYRGQFDLELKERKLIGEASFYERRQDRGEVRFEVPMNLHFYPLVVQVDTQSRAKMDVKYSGQINPFIQMILPQNHLLEGKGDVNFELRGPLANPNVQGTATLKNGYYENLYLGLVLKNLNTSIRGKGSEINLENFVATDDQGGRVEASGSLSLNQHNHNPFQVNVQMEKGRILQFDFLEASFNGEMYISGSSKGAKIQGDLDVITANIEIPNHIGSSLPKLKVSYLYPQNKACAQKNPKTTPFIPLDFDLHLDVLDKASLKGRGLDTRWAGKFDIKGTNEAPRFEGELKNVEGSFVFAGRVLNLNEGIIQFDGDLLDDTRINLDGTTNVHSTLINANLKGPILGPKLTFRSDPPYSQTEILSLILFNEPVQKLTPFQAVALTHSLSTLSGAYLGPDIIDKVRRGIGVDQLTFGSSIEEQGGDYTTIQIGKYITRNVLVTLNRPLTIGTSPFIITAHVRGGFQIQTYFDENELSKILIQWKLSY